MENSKVVLFPFCLVRHDGIACGLVIYFQYKRSRFPYFTDIFLYFLWSLISCQIIKVQGHLVLAIMCGSLTWPDGPPKYTPFLMFQI
jgi:hypothetical protein